MKKIVVGIFALVVCFSSFRGMTQEIGQINVNLEYGFLVFEKTADLEALSKQLVGNTHGRVREHFASIRFASMGVSRFENLAAEEVITEEQAQLYLLSNKGIIQVKDVLIKQIDQNNALSEWSFLLTMTSDKLNSENYENLSTGSFRNDVMNKFANGQEIEGDLFTFIKNNPSGYENNGSGVDKSSRPFWGPGKKRCHDVSNGAGGVLYTECCWNYYILFIDTGVECSRK